LKKRPVWGVYIFFRRFFMKRKSILRVMLTIMVTFCFLLAGCKDSGGDDSTTIVTPDGTFTTIAEFETWLDAQPANTAETPYTVKVNVSDLGGDYDTTGSLGNALYTNDTKYVNLDLSGSTITSIGDYAFFRCSSLTGITIPAGVTSIVEDAFGGCRNLTSITVAPGNNNYASEAGFLYNKVSGQITHILPSGRSGNVTIPNGVTSIGDYAFDGCTSLTSITIGSGVTSIGYCAFNECTSLTSITIPASVTSIGGQAFIECTSLASVTIGSGVTSIGQEAFENCTSLTSVTIPASVTSIGILAFNYCTSLTSVTFAVGSDIASGNFGTFAFPEASSGNGGGTLRSAYNTGKAGTYTRADKGSTWTKSS
jgi:hypothetical protein